VKADDFPILFVPGVLGTTLVERSRSRLAWGSARGLLRSRETYLPPESMDALLPGDVLWSFVVVPGLYSVPVYEDLAASLEAIGYRRAPLVEPTGKRALYGLAHDWRRDIVVGARAIEDAVARLRTRLGVSRVHLLGHSWGCNLIRYYLRYGGADVISEPGETPRPGAESASTFFAVGPLYGGTLRALHEANHGFPVGPFGLGVSPDQASTTPCLYQLLPYDDGRAIDEEGRAAALDLSDVETWKAFSWGPFLPAVFERLYRSARRKAPDLDRSAARARLEDFLGTCLRRGKRVWDLLQERHPADVRVRTVTCAVRDTPTLTKLVLPRGNGSGQTATTESLVAQRFPNLLPEVTAPGDGYVAFAEVRRQAPAGGELLSVAGCSHRFLYNREEVLESLLRNLGKAQG
jgi:pimeloyl-ACP methyl ester carboxylesterase